MPQKFFTRVTVAEYGVLHGWPRRLPAGRWPLCASQLTQEFTSAWDKAAGAVITFEEFLEYYGQGTPKPSLMQRFSG